MREYKWNKDFQTKNRIGNRIAIYFEYSISAGNSKKKNAHLFTDEQKPFLH